MATHGPPASPSIAPDAAPKGWIPAPLPAAIGARVMATIEEMVRESRDVELAHVDLDIIGNRVATAILLARPDDRPDGSRAR